MSTIGPLWLSVAIIVACIFRELGKDHHAVIVDGTVEAAHLVLSGERLRPEGAIVGCSGEEDWVIDAHFFEVFLHPCVWRGRRAEWSTDARVLSDCKLGYSWSGALRSHDRAGRTHAVPGEDNVLLIDDLV